MQCTKAPFFELGYTCPVIFITAVDDDARKPQATQLGWVQAAPMSTGISQPHLVTASTTAFRLLPAIVRSASTTTMTASSLMSSRKADHGTANPSLRFGSGRQGAGRANGRTGRLPVPASCAVLLSGWARCEKAAGLWVKPGLTGRVKQLRGKEKLRHASLLDFRDEI